jgi:hypothetical protein
MMHEHEGQTCARKTLLSASTLQAETFYSEASFANSPHSPGLLPIASKCICPAPNATAKTAPEGRRYTARCVLLTHGM